MTVFSPPNDRHYGVYLSPYQEQTAQHGHSTLSQSTRTEINFSCATSWQNGAIPEFSAMLTSNGHKVIWLDYYQAPEGSNLNACAAVLADLSGRLRKLSLPNVSVVDAKDAIDPSDLSLFDDDLVHPSPKGGWVLAKHLAKVMQP